VSEVDLGADAFWWLIATGMLFGIGSTVLFRRWSDGEKIRIAANAMLAHLMEFRLFVDEPDLILRAQRDLLLANARLLRLMLTPMLLLTVPSAVTIAIASAFFSQGALRPGEAAVVTAHYRGELPDVELRLPIGVALETLPVRIPREHEISWRVRPSRACQGNLQLRLNSRVLAKSISAGSGLHWISEQRAGSVLSYLAHPLELPFSDGTIDWVRVQYHPAKILGLHWTIWFSAAAGSTALVSAMGGLRK